MQIIKIFFLIILICLLISRDTCSTTRKIFNHLKSKENINTKEQPFGIETYNNINANTIIVSHYTINNNTFINHVIQNHRQYATKHGYDYWFRNGILDQRFGDVLYWQKTIVIKQAMNITDEYKRYKYKWILWVDGDVLFTNFNKSLEDLKKNIKVDNNNFLIIGRDMTCTKNNICPKDCCFNVGVLLIHNNEQSRKFIEKIINNFSRYNNNPLPEQAAIQDEILKPSLNLYKKYQNKCTLPPLPGVLIVDSTVINSGYVQNWRSGHFIAHFAGTGNTYRDNVIPKFLQCLKDNKYHYSQKCEHPNLN